ncbi:hypothetical protein C7B64_22605, partial [Merismopedia glauca CCAP 1448/3]
MCIRDRVNTHQSSNLGLSTSHLHHAFSSDSWSTTNRCEASTWVHLLESPSPLGYQEALLLCPHSEDEWVAWIPDHGEEVLHISQFCVNY